MCIGLIQELFVRFRRDWLTIFLDHLFHRCLQRNQINAIKTIPFKEDTTEPEYSGSYPPKNLKIQWYSFVLIGHFQANVVYLQKTVAESDSSTSSCGRIGPHSARRPPRGKPGIDARPRSRPLPADSAPFKRVGWGRQQGCVTGRDVPLRLGESVVRCPLSVNSFVDQGRRTMDQGRRAAPKTKDQGLPPKGAADPRKSVRDAVVSDGKPLSPAGKQLSPAGKPLGPAGKQLSPAGKQLSPAGKRLRPAGSS